MRLTSRLVTIFCYLLPFTFFVTTCNDVHVYVAYNQKEADKNILAEEQSWTLVADTTLTDHDSSVTITRIDPAEQNSSTDTTKVIFDSTDSKNSIGEKLIRKILFPTDTSLSGIGSIFYSKNLPGKIAMGICMFISLLLLVAPKFLKSQKTILYFLLTALLCLTIFIIDCFISEITLLWGAWILLALLLLQLKLEFDHRAKEDV